MGYVRVSHFGQGFEIELTKENLLKLSTWTDQNFPTVALNVAPLNAPDSHDWALYEVIEDDDALARLSDVTGITIVLFDPHSGDDPVLLIYVPLEDFTWQLMEKDTARFQPLQFEKLSDTSLSHLKELGELFGKSDVPFYAHYRI